ncbi:MAG: glycosyltransferase family 39 protein [Chloroflexota bacterium]|nr:glycosyltransferase family 39 protein [Chloroflexota bacterium]
MVTSHERSRQLSLLGGIVLLALILRGVLLVTDSVPLNSDEAVVGLMARHILAGERPVFYYGQAYMGSLDAWLIAGVFALFGISMLTMRLVQVLLFAGFIASTWLLARRFCASEEAALLSALYIALPPVLLTLYTTATLGGYGEVLLLGNLVLLLGYDLVEGRDDSYLRWLALGVAAGIGFWTLGLIVVYLVPVGILLLWRLGLRPWRGYLLAGLAFLIFSSPWWFYNFTHGQAALLTLYDPRPASDPLAPILPLVTRFVGFFLVGLTGLMGLRYPWSAEWISPLLGPLALVFYGAALVYGLIRWLADRRTGAGNRYGLLWLMAGAFFVLFVGTRFGSDSTGRYLLPLYVPLSVFSADLLGMLRRRSQALFVVALVSLLAFNLVGHVQGAQGAAKITTQFNYRFQFDNAHDAELIAFLLERGQPYGYSNYWVAYKIAFLSDERVILAPRLPYKENLLYAEGDDRYPAYTARVRDAECVVYVTSNQPALDTLLRERFTARGITFRERELGPYRVFYELSRNVSPDQLWQG